MVDIKNEFSPKDIDILIQSSDWFPFVETWSSLSPEIMFDNLSSSDYGGGATSIPKVNKSFTPDQFTFSIPDRFRKPIPLMVSPTGNVILTRDVDNKDYRHMNAVGEYYMEDIRLSSSKRKFKTETPIEIWDKEKKHILQLARTRYGQKANPYDIRNTVFSYTKESNPFRPSIALAVYSLLDAHSILDMSSGWGDRLIGALAWANRSGRKIRYQGYDPFCELQHRYAAMIKDLNQDSDSQFQVKCSPFEESPIEANEFDVAFTSPPYFDFEEYGLSKEDISRTEQSTVRYPQVQDWVDGFLKPMMQRAARSLRVGGYLAVNIEGPFMYRLLDSGSIDLEFKYPRSEIETALRMDYLGIIGYSSDEPKDRFIHPIFVWRRRA